MAGNLPDYLPFPFPGGAFPLPGPEGFPVLLGKFGTVGLLDLPGDLFPPPLLGLDLAMHFLL